MVTGLTQIYNIGFVKNFCAESWTKPSLDDLFIAAFIQFHTITAATYRRIYPAAKLLEHRSCNSINQNVSYHMDHDITKLISTLHAGVSFILAINFTCYQFYMLSTLLAINFTCYSYKQINISRWVSTYCSDSIKLHI